MKTLYLIVFLLPFCSSAETEGSELKNDIPAYSVSWKCKDDNCIKTEGENQEEYVSLDVCKLNCGHGTLWPLPTGNISVSSDLVSINPNTINIEAESFSSTEGLSSKVKELTRNAGKLFVQRVGSLSEKRNSPETAKKMNIYMKLKDPNIVALTQDTDESYALEVSQMKDGAVNATIEANNFFGARHGLETLSQLIVYDSVSQNIVVPSKIYVTDAPQYKYRGILLDTSRNYISVPAIKTVLDAMSVNKLNTFHWHITDTHSFPFVSKTYPLLSKFGAYSEKEVYTPDDIKSIIEFARVRGIRVIPEFDAPAHVGSGWQWVGDNATVCFNSEPWQHYCVEPPCGQLNPTSEKMYTILEGIYKDLAELFESDIFHMGGDEVNLNCWNSSDVVVENMAKMNLGRSDEDFHKLWSYFQSRALNILEKVSVQKPKSIVLFTSSLTSHDVEKYLDKSKYIIQIWTKKDDGTISELLNKGYRLILSNYDALYFDCGFGAWVGNGLNWCSPYIPWQTVYDNDPEVILKDLGVDVNATRHLMLGSEAALWTEQADDASINNRFWPRGAAHAERLWGTKGDWKQAENRFVYHRQRLFKLGFQPDTIKPQWCLQNEGSCYINKA